MPLPKPQQFAKLEQWAERLVLHLEQTTKANPFSELPAYARTSQPKAVQEGLLLFLRDVVGDDSLGFSDGSQWRELYGDWAPITVGANHVMAPHERVVLTTAGIQVTLPAVTMKGRRTVLRTNTVGNVTVVAPTGTINGAANHVLTLQWQFASYVSDGANYFIVG